MYGSPSLAIPPLYRSPICEGALPYIEDPLILPPSRPRRGTTFPRKAKLKVSMLQIGGNVDNGFDIELGESLRNPKPTGNSFFLVNRDGNAGNGFTAAYKLFPGNLSP